MENGENNLNFATPRWLHYLAVATASATFPLVIVGGVVTTARIGMADTVWPTPPWYFVWLIWVGQAMDQGIGFLVEHGHRQLGWLVGLFTLTLGVGLWVKERRTWLRWLGVLAVAAVIAQGVLGGLRVVLISQALGLVHGVFAQFFFALTVCLAAFTSRRWSAPCEPVPSKTAGRLRKVAIITTAMVFLQLIFGATLRHLGYTWALVAHLITALLIVVHVALIAKRVFLEHAMQPSLVRPVEWLSGLVLCQLMLGAGAWGTSSGFGFDATAQSGAQLLFATAHVSVGALILAACTVLTIQTYRLLAPLDAGTDGGTHGSELRSRSAGARPAVSSLESREFWAQGVAR
jgi:cytochrome c oxidase assembly protein subunit 15